MATWWKVLNDPVLTGLVERAVVGSFDLKEAQARIREARASRGVEEAGRFPTLSASGSYKSTRSSASTSSTSSTNARLDSNKELYSAGFDASWEIDLFGSVRRSVESAQASLEASQEDYRNTLVSLAAEVAINYTEARTYQEQLAVAQKNLNAQTETFQITSFNYQAGLTTALDVEQARYSLESTKAGIPQLQTSLQAALNRLAVLIGEYPGAVDQELAAKAPVPTPPLEIAVGVPAEALRRRPDIRKAERELAAQTAQIGVATAELYPKLTLSGSIGLESLTAGNLFRASSRTTSLGPSFSWNIFSAGKIRQNIAVQNALQEQKLAAYESAVRTAVEEVENAIVAYAQEQYRRESLKKATAAASRAVKLALDQYKSGIIDFQSVLETQKSLLSFQDQLATSEGTVTSNLIKLYKALGGGWTPMGQVQ